jgi:hypothetical protein
MELKQAQLKRETKIKLRQELQTKLGAVSTDITTKKRALK